MDSRVSKRLVVSKLVAACNDAESVCFGFAPVALCVLLSGKKTRNLDKQTHAQIWRLVLAPNACGKFERVAANQLKPHLDCQST